jgi:decaprenylphospho-beta-D-erythro-pentofuranosid-2-ulose 2-reductase
LPNSTRETDVRDAFGRVQSLLVLGGSSDIGAAIAERLVRGGGRIVVLAGRHPNAMEAVADRLRDAGAERVEIVEWDATHVANHAAAVEAAFAAGGDTDIDAVVLAAGVLGDQAEFDEDPIAAATAVVTNYGGPVATLLHVADRLRTQGHGTIVVLSSVAAERPRQGNYVYGSTKAGLDAFAQGLGDALVGTGVRVLLVRPGFVRSTMTEGRDAAPFATTPDKVADAVVAALAGGQEIVWVPSLLRYVFIAFRHMPRGLWRRVSERA